MAGFSQCVSCQGCGRGGVWGGGGGGGGGGGSACLITDSIELLTHNVFLAVGRGQAFAAAGGAPLLLPVVEDWVKGLRSQLLQWSARLLGQEQWQPYSSAQVLLSLPDLLSYNSPCLYCPKSILCLVCATAMEAKRNSSPTPLHKYYFLCLIGSSTSLSACIASRVSSAWSVPLQWNAQLLSLEQLQPYTSAQVTLIRLVNTGTM